MRSRSFGGSMRTLHYVAFLRAINVAGHASLNMADARDAFLAAGGQNVRTYIQSGNVIFQAPAAKLMSVLRQARTHLSSLLDEEPEIAVRRLDLIEEIVERRPFRSAEAERGIKLYVAFLFRKPRHEPIFPLTSSREALEAIAMTGREVFIISRRKTSGFYGFPNNFIEKALGVPATSRNWSTITNIVESYRRTATNPEE
jgi:uncharacterized protein (DUF1697 family)